MASYKTPVVFYVWDIDPGDEELIRKMSDALLKETNKINGENLDFDWELFDGHKVDDYYHEQIFSDENLVLCFGFDAIDASPKDKEVVELPAIKDIKSGELKTEAWEVLKDVAKLIVDGETPVETFVEKDNISVGIGADIEITEKDAEYLKKIRDLLGGGKMVITKGELRIEVE